MAVNFDEQSKRLDHQIAESKKNRFALEAQLKTANTDVRTILSEQIKVYNEEIKRLLAHKDRLLDIIA